MALRTVPAMAICAMAFAAMSGCAARPPVAFDPPSSAACCSSWKQVHFKQMTSNEVSGVTISIENSPTFEFSEGRSTFVAYQLPSDRFSSMMVETYTSSDLLPMATLFRPRALFLDSHLSAVGTADLAAMKRGSKPLRGAYYYSTTSIPADATYVVIYAASSRNTDRIVTHSRNGEMYAFPNAYEGKISIILR